MTQTFTLPVPTKEPTKRSILRFIASHFDPLGLISPALLSLKYFLQTVNREKRNWKSGLFSQAAVNYDSLLRTWKPTAFILPRKLHRIKEIHAFTDASTKPYAAALYGRDKNENTNVLFAKSRLCPINGMSAPQLELLRIQIGIWLLKFVTTEKHLQKIPKHLQSDSKCALPWSTTSAPEKLSKFVENRVIEIRTAKDVQLKFIYGADNPADIATRGISPTELDADSNW